MTTRTPRASRSPRSPRAAARANGVDASALLQSTTDPTEFFAALAPKRAMAVFAHPDDCEFSSGGTIAVLTRLGWEVDIVVATSGNKGTKDPGVTPQQLAGEREEEQRAAARILGAREPVFFGFPDGGLVNDDELRGLVVRQLRLRRPELLITWDGFRPGFNHRDHRRVGRAAYDAVYPSADDHLYYPLDKEEDLLPHRPLAMLLVGGPDADFHVDIEPVVRTKVRATLAHVSQMGGRQEGDMLRMWRERAAAAGDSGPRMRESFKRVVLRR
jgi:LmbE family N-acetylglucosaminyl deacetylase